jgi:hypothetical protein
MKGNMFFAIRTFSILVVKTQPRLSTRQGRLMLVVASLGLMLMACHRPPQPWDPDRRLPKEFDSPQATFSTWITASRGGDETSIRACYWSGLSQAELSAWLSENLRPEARALFDGARLTDLRPTSPVEMNFAFTTSNGTLLRGVIVRTGQGWKIQSW